MLSVEEAVAQVRLRGGRDWVPWALGRGSWPMKVNLQAPRGTAFDRDITAAKLWSSSWEAFARNGAPGRVLTETRRARGLGTSELATAWVFDGPDEVLALTPDLARRHARARDRFAEAVAMPQIAWESVESIPLKAARTIAELGDGDWSNAVAVVAHIAGGAGEAAILRQLAIPGVHTKWIEDNAALIAAMLGVPAGDGDPRSRLEAHIGLMAESVSVGVYLACPRLRSAVGGLDRFTANVQTLNGSSLAPRTVLIVENMKLGHSLDFEFDDLAVLYGLGKGAMALAPLRWLAAAESVLYWGDMDRAGLAILASLRRTGVAARSVLMGDETWDRYSELRHDSPRSQLLDQVNIPAELIGTERRLYARLNAEIRRGGAELQLEQEHIPLGDAVAAIAAALRDVADRLVPA